MNFIVNTLELVMVSRALDWFRQALKDFEHARNLLS